MCEEVNQGELPKAKKAIIQAVQHEAFPEELKDIRQGKDLAIASPIKKLSPYLDDWGLLSVGVICLLQTLKERRKTHSSSEDDIMSLTYSYIIAVSMPKTKVATSEKGPYDQPAYGSIGGKVSQQSYLFFLLKTPGANWTSVDGRLTSRMPVYWSPFSYVGVDVFVPWIGTRGGLENSKCWAVLFTCMSSRAIHEN